MDKGEIHSCMNYKFVWNDDFSCFLKDNHIHWEINTRGDFKSIHERRGVCWEINT